MLDPDWRVDERDRTAAREGGLDDEEAERRVRIRPATTFVCLNWLFRAARLQARIPAPSELGRLELRHPAVGAGVRAVGARRGVVDVAEGEVGDDHRRERARHGKERAVRHGKRR